MTILDTDILTIVQRAAGGSYSKLLARLQDPSVQPVFVTIVSFEEQMRGWLAYVARAKDNQGLLDAYGRLFGLIEDFRNRPVLPFDEPAAIELQRLRRLSIRVAAMDLRIAAIAISNNATLLSRNLKDFRKIPNLKLADWDI